jgi:hypothetical protein
MTKHQKVMEKLKELVPPPSEPAEAGPAALRVSIEESIGLGLPSSLFDFASSYGSGRFKPPDGNSIYIFNPFSSDYIDSINNSSWTCQEIKRAEGADYLPYGIYPEQPGLLACGYGEGGRDLYWLTEGHPDEWPILLWPPERRWVRFDLSLPAFLVRLFTGKVNTWGAQKDATWFRKQQGSITFRSFATPGSNLARSEKGLTPMKRKPKKNGRE